MSFGVTVMLALALLFYAVAALSGIVGFAAVAAAATTMATVVLVIGLLGFVLTLVLAVIGRSLAL